MSSESNMQQLESNDPWVSTKIVFCMRMFVVHQIWPFQCFSFYSPMNTLQVNQVNNDSIHFNVMFDNYFISPK